MNPTKVVDPTPLPCDFLLAHPEGWQWENSWNFRTKNRHQQWKIVKQILYVNYWCISLTFNSKTDLHSVHSRIFTRFFGGSHWWSLSCFSPWPGNECLVAEILLLISTPSAQVQWGIPTAGFSKNLFLILIVFSWILSATKWLQLDVQNPELQTENPTWIRNFMCYLSGFLEPTGE